MDLEILKTQALDAVAGTPDLGALEAVRVRFMGGKGEITELLKGLGAMAPDERKVQGAAIHTVKEAFLVAFAEKKEALEAEALAAKLAEEAVDVTLPGAPVYVPVGGGKIHPLTLAMEEIAASLKRLGFVHAFGPELETDDYNFTKLNLPLHHPARQDQDTFYVTERDDKGLRKVLRTQTSNVQIRTLEAHKPPFRVMGVGRVYRRDYDLTHTPQFHQVEGMMVETGTTFANMIAVLNAFLAQFFEQDVVTRLRPHYFPFTEPSAEMDMKCVFCKGEGCRVCKDTGWLEILGCGMVHRNVLAVGEVGPGAGEMQKISGFAFGAGVERLAMLKYGIGDLRLFYESYGAFLDHYGKAPIAAA
ncbi:MAG: phenylalanine--tRNA ligase subunit alpha [Alphaproteobacteria bacterium CG_4_10_14_0_8_um_filter_53_9]|nr:MAG: phenylalanine--tRNA ligase subunit alpha [Alphaproteobacteria bacterium CG_4_10_14_0_8_um_filter_53_9]